ncbi:MAG: hypothetical protein HDT14_11750 [Oscillibacter sp.]|nr:hypothetical protein [Oscillibacter sp.]
MHKNENRLAAAGLIFSIFLFLCAVINFVGGYTGAGICAAGAGMFFLTLSSAAYGTNRESEENRY